MHILAETTSQAHLDGTTGGIVVMMAVMLPALALFIILIYWSAREPRARKGHLQPATSLGSAGAAGRPVTAASGHGASRLLAENVEPDEVTSGS